MTACHFIRTGSLIYPQVWLEKLGYLEKGVTELQCYYLFLPVEAIR